MTDTRKKKCLGTFAECPIVGCSDEVVYFFCFFRSICLNLLYLVLPELDIRNTHTSSIQLLVLQLAWQSNSTQSARNKLELLYVPFSAASSLALLSLFFYVKYTLVFNLRD